MNGYLLGGFNHLEKYEFVNGKDYPIYYGKHKTCLKPLTSYDMLLCYHQLIAQ